MRRYLIGAAVVAMLAMQAGCLTPTQSATVTQVVAGADTVTLDTERGLIVATDAYDVILLRVEAHVQGGDLHGQQAATVHHVLIVLGQAIDAAHAAQLLGNHAVAAAKLGEIFTLIAGVHRDFPALMAATH